MSIEDENGDTQTTAEFKEGSFWYAGVSAFPMKNDPPLDAPKVAILMSRWTWSSGEFIAVAFKGQKHTRFFGEHTGGYTTNNGWEVINDEIALVMSTGVYCDRNGIAYSKYVSPDEEIVFEVESDKARDTGIRAATTWLQSAH